MSATPGIELLFLGTGTSSGVPMIACHCPVCTSADPKDKRTRPSVIVSYAGATVLIDTSPELRLQCLGNRVEHLDAIVFTHAHADHVMGLDDVRRFNYIKGGPLDAWADRPTLDALMRCFGYAFNPPKEHQKNFLPQLRQRPISGPFEIGAARWTPIPLRHGVESILGFRVGAVAYCTDVSEIPESSFELLQGLDLLVLGALRHEKHNKHFSLEEAITAARRIGAAKTRFTHIAHNLPHVETNLNLPKGMRLAYDGERIGVNPLG